MASARLHMKSFIIINQRGLTCSNFADFTQKSKICLQKCSSEELNLCPSIDREVTSITLSVWVLEICRLPIVQVCKMESAWTEEIDYVSGQAKLQPKTRVVDTIKKNRSAHLYTGRITISSTLLSK